MITENQDPQTIKRILDYARTIAIVGLSSNPLRASHFVGFYLQRHGYRVIPVNPRETEVLGERSYADLADVPERIDVVDVFRRGDAVADIARTAAKIGARALWLQFGVDSPEGVAIARAANMDVVVDRCLKIEHARYRGRMHWLGFNTGVIGSRRG